MIAVYTFLPVRAAASTTEPVECPGVVLGFRQVFSFVEANCWGRTGLGLAGLQGCQAF